MTQLWYQNPIVLLKDYNEFYPDTSLDRIHTINSLARFAIYYSILLLIHSLFPLVLNTLRWFIIPYIIINKKSFLIKLFLYMEYYSHFGDLKHMYKSIFSHLYSDHSDIFPKFIRVLNILN